MKLSDAIELGSTLITLSNRSWHKPGCHGCLIGLALEATGRTKDEWLVGDSVVDFEARWPWVRTMPLPPWNDHVDPVYTRSSALLTRAAGMILAGELTFDTFLRWLRSVEPAEAPEPTTAAVEQALEELEVT